MDLFNDNSTSSFQSIMKSSKLITLSTTHLHPLEAQKMNEVSILYNEFNNLISICDGVIQDCKDSYLPCLAELLNDLMTQGYDYVLFDPDAEVDDSVLYCFDW